jgi:hypothetical protein
VTCFDTRHSLPYRREDAYYKKSRVAFLHSAAAEKLTKLSFRVQKTGTGSMQAILVEKCMLHASEMRL